MRMLVVIGGFLIALLGAAFVLTVLSDAPQSSAPQSVLQPLENALGRPIVMYVDGPVSPAFDAAIRALDAPVGALADRPDVRTLLDLDVYVMVRDTWDVFSGIEDHDLGALIRQRVRDKTADAGVAWFEAALEPVQGPRRDLLVILAAQEGLAGVDDFCVALTIYDMVRFSRNGAAFFDATEGEGSQWKRCRARGWTSVADMDRSDN